MMGKKILLFFFILISMSCFSQKYNFVYEYKFKPDSLNLEEVKTELMGLFINKDESIYVSINKMNRDSEISRRSEDPSLSKSVSLLDFPQSKISYIIQKKSNANEITFFQNIDGNKYKIVEKPNFNWQISSEISEIKGKKCQLAKLDFKGRKYNAWFTEEIPISEGPYKFKGLPGLIIKIEDERKEHIWELQGIEKFKNLTYDFSKYIMVSDIQYKKVLQEYINDPFRKMREFNQRFNVISSSVTTPDGKMISGAEFEKIRTKEIQENFKRNNNSIELK